MKMLSLFAVAITLACVLVWWTPREAEGVPGCNVEVHGAVGVVICADEPVGSFPLPTVTVTEHVTRQVRIPGPTATVTVPGATVTIRPPADTQTQIVPGPTQTKTETVTVGPSELPTPNETTVTPTESPLPTGQATPSSGRMGPSTEQTDSGPFSINFGDGKTSVIEAGIGILTLLALVGLLLITMYAGYILGYKDKERKDTDFMRALLEIAKLRRVK